MKTNALDPDVAALALSQSVVLRKTIETAGAVRDLVYDCMTQHEPVFKATSRMFAAAMDTLPRAPDSVDAGFARAFRAAGSLQDRAAGTIMEIVREEVEKSLAYLAHWGANQAVANRFSAAFPDEAGALAKPSSGRPGGSARLDHLSMLAQVFQAAVPRGPPGWPPDGRAETAFNLAARAAASHAADEGWDSASPAFALAAAASAVMVAFIPDNPRNFLRRAAPGICRNLSKAISLAGGPQELASAIPAAILEGALKHPNDGIEASGEVAVRGLRMAHMWTSAHSATSAFRTVSGMAAGAAWATADDRAHFESIYGQALEVAGRLDPVIHYAFNTITKYSWKKMPFVDADEDTWEFFYGTSGRTMAEWVKVSQGVNYRAFALAQENAALICVYGAAHDGASETAARTASKMRRTSR